MKRRTLRLLTVLALALCLLCTACGGDTEETVLPQDDSKEGLGGGSISEVDTSDLAGIYIPTDSDSEWDYLDIHDDSTWMLYGQNADISGWLGYDEKYEAIYAYEDSDGSGCLFYVDDSDGTLYFASYGYFYDSGMDNMWDEDCGTFSYSTDESSAYYADSTMHDGVSYRVFEFDEDVLVWGDEGAYYLME